MFGMKRTLTLTLLGAGIAAATIGAAPAKANPVPPNCEKHPWGFLGLTKIRLICDEPIRPDGSWMRRRIIGIPAHYEPATSSCSSGSYSSQCTFWPGGWVAHQIDDDEYYPVRAETVLPDEPGHMPDPAPAPPPV
jgi:hypothetical protein